MQTTQNRKTTLQIEHAHQVKDTLTIPGSGGKSSFIHNNFATTPKNIFRNIFGTSYPLAPLWWIFNVNTVIAVANETIAILIPQYRPEKKNQ